MHKRTKRFLIAATGLVGGVLYGFIEARLDYYAETSAFVKPIHDFQEFFLPIVLGCAISFGIYLFFRQKELNKSLSAELTTLKSKILANTFASYILHEIRNPVHNLNAVFEKNQSLFDAEDRGIVDRNLERLIQTTDQLKQMYVLSDQLDVGQGVDFLPWLDTFKVRYLNLLLKKNRAAYSENIHEARLKIHPLLLEQCLTLIMDNAAHAVLDQSRERWVSLDLYALPERPDRICLEIRNSGASFPESVLAAAGQSKIKSAKGSGLGLVLVRDTLRHVHGELRLANHNGYAQVILQLPGELIR